MHGVDEAVEQSGYRIEVELPCVAKVFDLRACEAEPPGQRGLEGCQLRCGVRGVGGASHRLLIVGG